MSYTSATEMILAISGISSPVSPLRVAAPVDPLVVGQHDLGDRAVHPEVAQHVGAQLRVLLDRHPVLVGQRAAPLMHSIRQREVADVVQQPSGVRELLVLLAHPDRLGHVAREAGNGGGMPGGPLIADVERAQQAGEHAPRERDVLLGAVARLVEQMRHVGEREHRGERERDAGQPNLDVDRRAGYGQRDGDRSARQMLHECRGFQPSL